MLQAACAEWDNVSVTLFDGLLVDFCPAHDVDVIIKGVRAGRLRLRAADGADEPPADRGRHRLPAHRPAVVVRLLLPGPGGGHPGRRRRRRSCPPAVAEQTVARVRMLGEQQAETVRRVDQCNNRVTFRSDEMDVQWLTARPRRRSWRALRELILNARSMPMSASCVINRGDVLAAIDDVIDNLPDEIADAQARDRPARRPRSPRVRPRPGGSWPRPASTPRCWPSTARWSGSPSSRPPRCWPRPRRRRPRCAGRPTSSSTPRMASFESVLHKTTSQVKTARLRLAERSGLDGSAPDRSTPRALAE